MGFKTIWKYELRIDDTQNVAMPMGAEILSVQTQAGVICLWTLVDPALSRLTRIFEMYGTGQSIPEPRDNWMRKFIATIQTGPLVFHVFETYPQ